MFDMKKEKIIKTLEGYMQSRSEVLFSYLYGSYAKGSANRLSDVDVAVFVEEKSLPDGLFDYKLKLVAELSLVLKTSSVEVIVLNEASSMLAHQVLKHGVLISSRNEKKRVEFISKAFNRYSDYKTIMVPHRKMLADRIKSGRFGEAR